jgi:hypothetical protein
MQIQGIKKVDFSEQKHYIRLDVHKKSWHVTVLSKSICLRSFTAPPYSENLYRFITANFCGTNCFSTYETGFSGYYHHQKLNSLGIHNIWLTLLIFLRITKTRITKQINQIAESLHGGLLEGIHVFDIESEQFR